MKNEMITRAKLVAEVKQMDPKLREDDAAFGAALAAIASLAVGPSVSRVAKLTRIPRATVSAWARNWRRGGVWKGGKVAAAEWGHPTHGGVSFWCDVMVGLGQLQRS